MATQLKTPIKLNLDQSFIHLFESMAQPVSERTNQFGQTNQYWNLAAKIQMSRLCFSAYKNSEAANDYLGNKEDTFQKLVESDPKFEDMRTVYASEQMQQANKSHTVAIEVRNSLFDCYYHIMNEAFDPEVYQAQFDQTSNNKSMEDRRKEALKRAKSA